MPEIADVLAAVQRERAFSAEKTAAALELADLGFHILPVIPGNKRPPFPTGPGHADKATRDPAIIESWFRTNRNPYWEIALVLHLSGHVAIDVDIKPDRRDQTIRWFATLEQKCKRSYARGFAVGTACQTTPSRGWHYIFTEPEGVELRSRLAPTIEIQRHILVVAPSAGRKWIRHPRAGIGPFPEALISRARRPSGEPRTVHHRATREHSRRSVAGLIRQVESAYDGNRNRTLYWAACRLYERAHQETDVSDLIFAATCSGLPLEEAIRTTESARRMTEGNQAGAPGESSSSMGRLERPL